MAQGSDGMATICEVCGETAEPAEVVNGSSLCKPCAGDYQTAYNQVWERSHHRGGIRVRSSEAMHPQILDRARYNYAVRIGNEATDLWQEEGKLEEALPPLRKATAIFRQLGEMNSLSACLGNSAVILASLRRYEEALKLHREEEEICRDQGYDTDLGVCLFNQGNMHKNLGKADDARHLFKQAIDILTRTGERSDVLEMAKNRLAAL